MQRKCYGSTVVSKTISVGSTPTFCDFMKGFTMGPECLAPLWKVTEMIMSLAMWIICTAASIGIIIAIFAAIFYAIQAVIEEIKG